jgi:branched-chain amino acid transport system substrate-binding protein
VKAAALPVEQGFLRESTSGAKIIGLANPSGDTVNAIKQAGEFGIAKKGRLIFYIQSVKAVGPEQAQGLRFLTGHCWDRDEPSRAFAKKFAERIDGMVPSQTHAGVYSAVAHHLTSKHRSLEHRRRRQGHATT